MDRRQLQAALDRGGTVAIDGVVRIDRSLVVSVPVRIEGGLLLGPADAVLLDVQAPATLAGTELVRTGGFGHVLRTTSELRLDTVTVSGARSWAWEQHRRPPPPTEWHGAGVFVTAQGSLKATGLHVSGCTGSGVAAAGPTRWTRGSARSCRWGLWVSSGDAAVRDVTFAGNGSGVGQSGAGTLDARRCRFTANTNGLDASGPGRVEVSGGSVRDSLVVGISGDLLADLRIDAVSFVTNGVSDISAAGWCDVEETGCTVERADGTAVRVDDVARVTSSLPVLRSPLHLRRALQGHLDRMTGADRAEIVRRSLGRSDTVEDLRRFEGLVGGWGAKGIAWLDDGQREVLWMADLPGTKHRILRDPADRIWFLSDGALVTEGVRIEPGGGHVAIGEVIALANGSGVRLYELDGTLVATAPAMTETGPIYRVDVVGRSAVQVHRVVGQGLDKHARQFTWNIAEDGWTDAYTNTPSETQPYLQQVLLDAPWLGVTSEFAKQAWADGDLGAIALACDLAVLVRRR